jgi:hypothetical protein
MKGPCGRKLIALIIMPLAFCMNRPLMLLPSLAVRCDFYAEVYMRNPSRDAHIGRRAADAVIGLLSKIKVKSMVMRVIPFL